MCGVAAVAGPDPGGVLGRALEQMLHRGVRVGTGDGVAHVRLPIVGLSHRWDQPVYQDRWCLAFVGEVLDFREHRPDDECDLPLVTDTWCQDGPCGFTRFDGFWSVVARDQATGEVHAFVDYLAQKPLYYRGDVRLVASEPAAVAAAMPTAPDEVYLSAVLKWGYCPETWRTPHQEVRKLLPGECLVLRPDGTGTCRTVDRLVPRSGTPEDLKREVEAAVRRRVLSSDLPVAALVSGGLDSAITYTLARRHGDVAPYHVENGEGDEFEAVVGTADYGYTLPPKLQCDTVQLDHALAYMQEPLDLGSLLPQVALSDALRARTNVALTGDGADEFFGGYGRAARYDSQWSDVYHELVAWHLPRLDRVMMRNLVEVRSPFLARRVAELALGLPRPLRTDKRVLRELFRDDLPAGVADVPKRPLRTEDVELDREGRSRELVGMFRQQTWRTT